MAEEFFAIRAIPVIAGEWVPVATPINCNSWSVLPNASVLISTNPNNSYAQYTIQANVQEFVVPGGISLNQYRFPLGTLLFYLQAVSGSTTVVITFSI